MKVNIDVFLIIEGTKTRSGGAFNVNPREYKKDPDRAAVIVAYEYIMDIKRQTGYREVFIEKVVYDGNKDITELIRQKKCIPPEENLPF